MTKLCKCGCGQPANWGDWIRGHWNRGQGEPRRQAWKTRRDRYGPSGGQDKVWPMRRERYGPSGIKDLESYKEIMKRVNSDPETTKRKIETRHINDPTNEWAKQAAKTRKERDPNNEWTEKGWETRRRNDPDNKYMGKLIETRRANDPEGERFQKMWVERHRRDPDNTWSQRLWTTRRKNDPENLSSQKTVQTRRERYGLDMCHDPERRNRNISVGMRSGGSEKAQITRLKNDPEGLFYKKAWEARRQRDPDNLANKRAAQTRIKNDPDGLFYKNLWDVRRKNDPNNEWAHRIWDSYTPEEREARLRKSVLGQSTPNNLEKRIISICEEFSLPLEFTGDSPYPGLAGYRPDFVSTDDSRKILEIYGDYWHAGEDPQHRIDIFKKFDHDTLILWEREMMASSDEEIANRIINFLNQDDFTGGVGG